MARIYQTSLQGEAHIRLAVVDNPAQAELWVCRMSSWGLAYGDARWFITNNKQDANVWAYFGSIGTAQLCIHFVPTVGMAGWQVREHKLKGKIARF